MEHSHCAGCGAVIPECMRLHAEDIIIDEPEPVVVDTADESGDDTGEGAGDDAPDVNVDIDIHIEEESSHEEESHHEDDSDSGDDDDTDEDEGEDPDGEVVIGGDADSGLPELSEQERDRDRGHDLPMRRG